MDKLTKDTLAKSRADAQNAKNTMSPYKKSPAGRAVFQLADSVLVLCDLVEHLAVKQDRIDGGRP